MSVELLEAFDCGMFTKGQLYESQISHMVDPIEPVLRSS